MKDFAFSDRVLPLEVRIHPRAKRLILRLERGGRALRVSVPPGTGERQITDFVEKCRGWIEKKLEKFSPLPENGGMLRHGDKIPYLGEPYLIHHQAGRGVSCLGEDGQIIISGEAAHLPRRLRDFLQKQAREIMVPLVFAYAAQIAVKPTSIQFKDTKSRWGSCSASGALSFSWRIIMAPPEVIHYLVAHEVAHLVEMNHGRQFWRICCDLCPQTPAARAWLKRHGQTLQAINFNTV